MKTLESNDAHIPLLGLGTWQLRGGLCEDRVADALALGYRHVDTARMYDNHVAVGRGLRRSGVPREDVFLTTKLWSDELERCAVLKHTDRYLRELDVEYVDLLLIHWPSDTVPLEETLDAMLELREAGRVRHLGVSNFTPSWLEHASKYAPLVCDQVEYHPLIDQGHLLELLRHRGMALVAHSPLARGAALRNRTLREIASARGRTPAQVALRWLIQQDGVAAIPKAGRREHLEENLAIFEFELDAEEMERIHRVAQRESERGVDPQLFSREGL